MDARSLIWPGGEHAFALRMGEWRALQEKCDAGPEEVFNRIRLGRWRLDDLVETIRLGLVGGGMPAEDARKLVLQLFDLHPPIEFKMTAHAILGLFLIGPGDDQPKKPEGAVAPEASGSSPPSTAPEAS